MRRRLNRGLADSNHKLEISAMAGADRSGPQWWKAVQSRPSPWCLAMLGFLIDIYFIYIVFYTLAPLDEIKSLESQHKHWFMYTYRHAQEQRRFVPFFGLFSLSFEFEFELEFDGGRTRTDAPLSLGSWGDPHSAAPRSAHDQVQGKIKAWRAYVRSFIPSARRLKRVPCESWLFGKLAKRAESRRLLTLALAGSGSGPGSGLGF